ncbi:hypothetical protein ACIQXR_04710 [Peribacillus sp. NPDC097224]|uniref:hypothetical protein n=1 Tax=Peribacillus sp. NPDC097224 TaxID=3364399 RepID=UPI0037FB99CB
MEKINYCRIERYKNLKVELKDNICFIFEFDHEEDFKKVTRNFFQELIFKAPYPDLEDKLNQLLSWNAEYYSSYLPNDITLIILSECDFVFVTEGFHYKGRVEKENLKLLGFESLLDLEAKKYRYKLLLSAKDLKVSLPHEVYVRNILLFKK